MKRASNSLRGDTRGAVLAEFVIAIVPILMMFFSFVQLAHLATARLVMKHGAIVGARAAAVMTNAHDNTPGQPGGDNAGTVTEGVKAAMLPWSSNGALTGVGVSIDDQSSTSDPYGWVTVSVNATYNCNVPMGGVLVCGAGRTKDMGTEVARMPHQGAIYK